MSDSYSGEDRRTDYQRRSQIERAAGVWKWLAMLAFGVVIGGSPTYINMLLAQQKQVTVVDVDKEITVQQAALIQKLDDFKDSTSEQLNDMKARLEDMKAQLSSIQRRQH